jgi:hypothetical protein
MQRRIKNDKKMKTVRLFRISGLIFIIILVLMNLLTGCTNVNTAFYNKILNDFDTDSYYVALDIKSSSYKGPVIIENNNLYLFLHKTKGLNKEKYQSLMKAILVHHRALKLDNKNITKWNFIKLSEEESILRIANQGENKFIAHFFNGKALNYGIPEKEQNAIINQLYYWNIPAKIDKMTGELLIG